MKALSVRAPWWWYILHGGKDIENRDWPTRVRGRVLIHASKWWNEREVSDDIQIANQMKMQANYIGTRRRRRKRKRRLPSSRINSFLNHSSPMRSIRLRKTRCPRPTPKRKREKALTTICWMRRKKGVG
jgi:hypothetical protein